MPDYLGDDMRKSKKDLAEKDDDKPFHALDENDIAVLKRYGQGAYAEQLKQLENDIEECVKKVNDLSGVKESDTGLAPPSLWDIAADKQAMQSEQPLQVARCTKVITSEGQEPRYMINVKQFAKFVVELAQTVAPTDISEGMRVGVDKTKYQIHLPLPAKIDPSVTMMQIKHRSHSSKKLQQQRAMVTGTDCNRQNYQLRFQRSLRSRVSIRCYSKSHLSTNGAFPARIARVVEDGKRLYDCYLQQQRKPANKNDYRKDVLFT